MSDTVTYSAIEANIDQTIGGVYGEGALEFRLGPVPKGPLAVTSWTAAATTGGTLADGTYYVGFTYTIATSLGDLDTDLSQVAEVEISGALGAGAIDIADVDVLSPANNEIGGIAPAMTAIKCWVRVGTGTYYNVATITDPTAPVDFTITTLVGAPSSFTIPGYEINLDNTSFYVLGVGTQYIGTLWHRYYCIICRNKISESTVSKMTNGVARIVRVPTGGPFSTYEKLRLWDFSGTPAWKGYSTGLLTAGAAIYHQLPADIGETTAHTELKVDWLSTEEPAFTEPLIAGEHSHSHRYCDGAILFYCAFDTATPVTTFSLPVDVGWLCNIVA